MPDIHLEAHLNQILVWLIPALIMVESEGDPIAVGDGGQAVGILQIHPIMVEDANRLKRPSDPPFTLADRRSPETSIRMCRLILSHYGRHIWQVTGRLPDWQDLARVWNGGGSAWRVQEHPKEDNLRIYVKKIPPAWERINEENLRNSHPYNISP